MNWKELNNRLKLELDFNTQTELAEFLVRMAELADKKNHHPDFKVTKCSHLEIELYSHDQGKVTAQDMELSNEISELLKEK